eukprot:8196259-Alexandrium_andersonii.AAC.2
MAKLILYEVMSFMSIMHPVSPVSQYVDDLDMESHGHAGEVILSLGRAAVDLLRLLSALRHRVPPEKCTIVASTTVIA